MLLSNSEHNSNLAYYHGHLVKCALNVTLRAPQSDVYRSIRVLDGVNDGSVESSGWARASVPLPVVREEGARVMVRAVYNPSKGRLAFDNLRIRTEQKCYPR